MHIHKTIDLPGGQKIVIENDEFAENPTETSGEDTNLFLVAKHRQCWIPEPGEKTIPEDPYELLKKYKKTHWIFPLEAYIHSGVVLALSREGNFPDRQWDVSQLGFVFVAKSEWRLSKSARKVALSIVEEWNNFISGNVWQWVHKDADDNVVGSCGGYLGDVAYCEKDAEAAAQHVRDAWKANHPNEDIQTVPQGPSQS